MMPALHARFEVPNLSKATQNAPDHYKRQLKKE
jgi:hypothetical protein